MISGVVYLLRIFKMFHGLMNNPVYIEYTNVSVYNTTIYFIYIKIVYC